MAVAALPETDPGEPEEPEEPEEPGEGGGGEEGGEGGRGPYTRYLPLSLPASLPSVQSSTEIMYPLLQQPSVDRLTVALYNSPDIVIVDMNQSHAVETHS